MGISVGTRVTIWVMAQWPTQGVSLPPADRWERPQQPPSDPDLNRRWIDSAPLSFFFFFFNLSAFGCSHKYYNKNLHTNYDRTTHGNLWGCQVFQQSSHLSFDSLNLEAEGALWHLHDCWCWVVLFTPALKISQYLMISPKSWKFLCQPWWWLVCFDPDWTKWFSSLIWKLHFLFCFKSVIANK